MKIWYVSERQSEFIVFDFDSFLISITYEGGEEEYDFSDSQFMRINFPIHMSAEKEDITDVFWDYVPSEQVGHVQKSLLKHILM